MAVKLNGSGRSHAESLISSGKVDKTSSWSAPSPKDLGAGSDWPGYASWHLAEDTGEPEKTEARFKYPFGKGGKVYRSALIAIRQRAAQQGATDVFNAAGDLLDSIDGKDTDQDGKSASFLTPFEFKFAADGAPGAFSGYGSVFGVMDSHGDVIAPGAFAQTLATKRAEGRTVPMYMQHGAVMGADPRPVGVWTSIEEDGVGLKANGQLVGLDTETGKYNHALVKSGAMTGLSIAYRVKKADYGSKAGEPRRTIKQLDLGHLSIVDDPSNAYSRIESIKSVFTERDFERLLTRDAGLSRSEALIIINQGFKALAATRDAGDDGLREVVERAKRAAAIIQPA